MWKISCSVSMHSYVEKTEKNDKMHKHCLSSSPMLEVNS